MDDKTRNKEVVHEIRRWDMNDEQWEAVIKKEQETRNTVTDPVGDNEEASSLRSAFKVSIMSFSFTILSTALLFLLSKDESLTIALSWMTLGAIWLVPFVSGIAGTIAFFNEYVKYSKNN